MKITNLAIFLLVSASMQVSANLAWALSDIQNNLGVTRPVFHIIISILSSIVLVIGFDILTNENALRSRLGAGVIAISSTILTGNLLWAISDHMSDLGYGRIVLHLGLAVLCSVEVFVGYAILVAATRRAKPYA